MTLLLSDAFGGTCVSLVLCCVNVDVDNDDETLNSLKFAHWCSKIMNRPLPNVRVNDVLQMSFNFFFSSAIIISFFPTDLLGVK